MADAYETVRLRTDGPVAFLQIHRPAANNTINRRLVEECRDALAHCESTSAVVVLEGLPHVFCFGMDFEEVRGGVSAASPQTNDARQLYDLWLSLLGGPYITVAHVRGKANAGGIGFVAACDVVLAEQSAQFSLSELLFGLYPACVFPFLARRIGLQRANYFTATTQAIDAATAREWGLVDACAADSEALLRRQLLRLRRLSKPAIRRYKHYLLQLDDSCVRQRSLAVDANREMLTDRQSLAGIIRYVEHGLLPWESAV